MANRFGLWIYIKAAFNARLDSMFISPNWVMVSFFGLLGIFFNPGFLLIGAGIELLYLFAITTNLRFQKLVQARINRTIALQEHVDWQERINRSIMEIPVDDRKRFNDLKATCSSIIDFYQDHFLSDPDIIQRHQNSLNRLIWIFLQLLSSRQTLVKVTHGTLFSKICGGFEQKIQNIEQTLQKESMSDELRKSVESKLVILKQRLCTLGEAENKRVYIESELDRIEQQVELIKEQAAVSKDPQSIAISIDSISTSLGETSEWIKQQENVLSSMQETMTPPPLILKQDKKDLQKQ